jgi:exosortase A
VAYTQQVDRAGEPAVGDGAAADLPRPTDARASDRSGAGSGVLHALALPTGFVPDDSRRRAWRASLAVFATASAVLLWAFRAEIAAAVQVWSNSATFGHAFFIGPISLILFYRARHRLASLRPSPAPWATIPIAILAFAWAVGEMANAAVVKQLAFVGLWQALFLLVMGWRVTRAALFPLLYLYFAVPFGAFAIPVLQDMTAQIVVHLLRLTGVPVFLDGFLIQIPAGRFLVAEACAGARYLIVSVALGVLTAHLFFRSWPRRLLFVGLSIAFPVVANGIRAYSIVMLAHFTDYRTAAEFDHVLYGFVFLGVVTLSLLGLAAFLRDRRDPGLVPPAGLGASHRRGDPPPAQGRALATQAALSSATVAVIFLVQGWTAAAKEAPIIAAPSLLLPTITEPWQPATNGDFAWQPTFHGSDATLHGSYSLGSDRVDLHVGYYSHQREGAEVISDLTDLVGTGRQWRTQQVSRATIQINGAEHPYVRMTLAGKGDGYIVWYWYRIGGHNTNSRLLGKLLEVGTLLGGRQAAAIVTVGAAVTMDTQRTEALLATFLNHYLTRDGTLVRLHEPRTSADGTASP